MDAITLPRPSNTDPDVTASPSPAALNMKGAAALQLLVVGVPDFDGAEWMLAADAVATTTQFDVAPPDVDLSVPDLVEFVRLARPDAVVLEWSWSKAAAFAEAMLSDELAGSVPLMIVSQDGEASPDRFRCGVWEDMRPSGFDDVVSLLGAYIDRTAFGRCVAALQVVDLFERLLAVDNTDTAAPR